MNVLFVCTGNTCRSPMAEGYLKNKKIKDLSVKSAGIYAEGDAVSQNSAEVMAELGIDISSHISNRITMSLLDWADKIYCMSSSHKNALLSIGVDKNMLFVLGLGILDPFGQDVTVYENCRDEIIKEIDKIFSDITVRESKMDDSDAECIEGLEKMCFSAPWSKQALIESAENGTKFFIAEIYGKISGYIGINTVLDEGYITNIAVFPEYRKMGIGTALLAHTEEFAKNIGLSFITLEVRESNTAAISLYEKHGFKKQGQRKKFYINPTENALILTKRF